MDTVKTLVAFCHLQRAAYAVCAVCRACHVNTKSGRALVLCDNRQCQRQPGSNPAGQPVPVYCAPAASAMSCQLYNKFAGLTAVTPTGTSLSPLPLRNTETFVVRLQVKNISSLHSPCTSVEHMAGPTPRMCNICCLYIHLSIDYSSVRQQNKI